MKRRITRLLIANRGEIAVRIARAARDAGIAPLGIYSDADAHAEFLQHVDDAVRIGPGPAAESYLDVARILDAARTLRADALHPGYGFLSERAPFAQAVVDAGLVFVGPPPAAIAAMGDKTEAKRRAREHGVPVVPGYDGDEQSAERLEAEARAMGTPVLIKASAGGGGRGMRVVDDLATFREALESAQREALAAFGDAKVLLERYVRRPRHVEFQILADAHGTTLHLGERECSIQRRHQKIVEEAPSPALTPELRARMGDAAVRTARSVGYVNAGTVEFLLDEAGAFYFLEMNARLQVEHPVTELVYGLDLVRLQFEIAAGERLRLAQDDILARGWAIEARINAEDPARGYLPAAGTITRWHPPHGDGIRLDSGVRAGSDVPVFYDSLLAKLIVHGHDRAAAVDRLAGALEAFDVGGVRTNLPLLVQIVRSDAFRGGDTTTAFLSEHASLLEPASARAPDEAVLVALGAALAAPRAWRVGHVGIPVHLEEETRDVAVVASRSGRDGLWQLEGDLRGDVRFEVHGERVVTERDGVRAGGRATLDAAGVTVWWNGARFAFRFASAPSLGDGRAKRKAAALGTVTSPMPGKIVKVAVQPGDPVEERALLVVLEAMKMEHRIEATRAGVVKSVAVSTGSLVTGGATLVEFE